VECDSTVRQAMEKMKFHRYAAIPVLDKEGKYVGTLRNDDIFKYFLANGKFNSKRAELDEVMKILDLDYSHPLYHNAEITELFERVKDHNFVPVVDDRGCFIGIVLRRDVMNYLLKFYKLL
jgi:CBS-domain-containing membrane protein